MTHERLKRTPHIKQTGRPNPLCDLHDPEIKMVPFFRSGNYLTYQCPKCRSQTTRHEPVSKDWKK